MCSNVGLSLLPSGHEPLVRPGLPSENVVFPVFDEAFLGEVKLADPGPSVAGLAGLFGAGEAQGVEPLEPHFVVLGIGRLWNL